MSNQDRLLSDEELSKALIGFLRIAGQYKTDMERLANLKDLEKFFNTQKRLYAQEVVGQYEGNDLVLRSHIKEQRARIK